MRRVLLLAYYFPPSVDAGAKRALGFFRHLREHGWEPTVLTVRDGNYATADGDAWSDPEGVVRVAEARLPWQRGAPAGRPEAAASGGGAAAGAVRRLVRSALYVPDPWRGFHAPSLAEARRLHGVRPFDAVWTTSSPWTHLRTGAALARGGLRWVADLRDLWLRNQYGYPHGPARRALDARLERRWLARASAITTASESQAALVRRDAFGPPVHAVRNGYLEAAGEAPPERAGVFRIVFAGKVYAAGDPLAAPFLEVLAAWREREADELRRVRADFYGRVDGRFVERVEAAGLSEVVTFHGLVPREDAQRALEAADVGLVLMPRAHREIVVTKLYDALGALVPVLLLGPADGEAAAIVRDTRAGGVFDPGDRDGALAWLRARLAAGPEDAAARAARRERAARYSYAALAGELASVLDSVTR